MINGYGGFVRFREHSFHSGFCATIHHRHSFQFQCRSKPTWAVFCEVITLYKKIKNILLLLFVEKRYKENAEVFWWIFLTFKICSILKVRTFWRECPQASKYSRHKRGGKDGKRKNQISFRIFFSSNVHLFSSPPLLLPIIVLKIGSSSEFFVNQT